MARRQCLQPHGTDVWLEIEPNHTSVARQRERPNRRRDGGQPLLVEELADGDARWRAVRPAVEPGELLGQERLRLALRGKSTLATLLSFAVRRRLVIDDVPGLVTLANAAAH